jgi:hypothetical protein
LKKIFEALKAPWTVTVAAVTASAAHDHRGARLSALIVSGGTECSVNMADDALLWHIRPTQSIPMPQEIRKYSTAPVSCIKPASARGGEVFCEVKRFVSKLLVLVSIVALAILPMVAGTARAVQQEGAPVPVVDTFEDGGQRLKLIGLPTPDGDRLDVTLVYEDRDEQVLRSVTVDPNLVGTADGATFAQFLDEMDPAFLSYVRASLADRMLHLKNMPNNYERAVSRLFFPRSAGGGVASVTVEVNLAE